jgi:hypothetical protein
VCQGSWEFDAKEMSAISQLSQSLTEFQKRYRVPIALLFFVMHVVDLGSDIIMCVMLHNAHLRKLFLASAISLILTLVFTIFYDATIHLYVWVFGEVVANTFRLNRNVMAGDLFGGFISYFLGPLTPLLLPETYNTGRLTNRLSIVTAISEDIPQAIIALIVLLTQDGWNSELAFVQVLSSLFGGIIKYFAGIFFESNRKSLSDSEDVRGVVTSDPILTSQL